MTNIKTYIKTIIMNIKKIKYKALILRSIKVGLFAFVALFILSLLFSLVVNIFFLASINEITQGSIGSSEHMTFSSVLKTTSFIMNISLFSRLAHLKFGMLIFAIIPFIAFFFADRNDNRQEGITIKHIFIYIISSALFAILVLAEALVSKGTLFGVNIDFFNLTNFISTFCIAFFLQIVIGLNYDSHGILGIKSARLLTRILFGIVGLVAIVGMVYFMNKESVPILYTIIAIILLAPNIAIYGFFMLMGTSVTLGESLVSTLNNYGMDITFNGLPIAIKLIALTIFAIAILIALFRLGRTHYLKELMSLAFSFSIVSLFVAFTTTIELGTIAFFKDISLGISLMKAFLVPLIAIIVIGLLLKLIRDVVEVLKES
ncbi:MAG: hypothetical protein PF505_02015 [Vallitaleaceae bacterium]|nr:hypothetical protein [Vallitaleaceae bacterium]